MLLSSDPGLKGSVIADQGSFWLLLFLFPWKLPDAYREFLVAKLLCSCRKQQRDRVEDSVSQVLALVIEIGHI